MRLPALPILLLLAAAAPLLVGANWGECTNICTPETLWSSCACSFFNEATGQNNYAYSFESWQDAFSKVVTCPGAGQHKTWGLNNGLYRTDTTMYLAACVENTTMSTTPTTAEFSSTARQSIAPPILIILLVALLNFFHH